jgi:hypothetical protein
LAITAYLAVYAGGAALLAPPGVPERTLLLLRQAFTQASAIRP